MRRSDAEIAERLACRQDCFRLIAWTDACYQAHDDAERDRPWIERLLSVPGPSERDLREAHSWRTKAAWLIYSIGDLLPFLVHFLPDAEIRATLEASRRYFDNAEGVGDRVRGLLGSVLDEARNDATRILLIGHSLGSVIAYDTLWERSRSGWGGPRIDLLLTLGSPLGVRFVQHRLRGADAAGPERYPDNVRRWINIAAVGELRALDRRLSGDYAPMVESGLIEEIRDETDDVYNFFRGPEGLNVHRDYGYLVNPATGRVIADWWRRGS